MWHFISNCSYPNISNNVNIKKIYALLVNILSYVCVSILQNVFSYFTFQRSKPSCISAAAAMNILLALKRWLVWLWQNLMRIFAYKLYNNSRGMEPKSKSTTTTRKHTVGNELWWLKVVLWNKKFARAQLRKYSSLFPQNFTANNKQTILLLKPFKFIKVVNYFL